MSKTPGQSTVTIKSIAEELGISFSTVSKALNNSSLVKEETRQTVLAKANELGYSPNMLARGLRGKATKTIAAIYNDTVNPAIAYMLGAISQEMAQYGYTMLICDPQFNPELERKIILSILSKQIDFILISPTTMDSDNLTLLSGVSDRVILFGEPNGAMGFHNIHVDYEMGGYMSASSLLSGGHKKNLVLTEPLSFPLSSQFLHGIKKAYAEVGLPFSNDDVRFVSTTVDSSFRVMEEMWNAGKSVFGEGYTGVITFCDIVALGVYKAAEKHGLAIPNDLSVIGFDDNSFTEFLSPPLSTIKLPTEKMVESVVSILKAKLIGKKSDGFQFSMMPYFVSRKSVSSR